MTKFKVLTSITDVKKFSELIYDLVIHTETPQELESVLCEDFPEEGLQTLKSIVQKGYPSLRRLAVQVVNFAGGFIKDITISVEGEIISAHKLLLSFVLGPGGGL